MVDVVLSRPCDACGGFIGGGYRHCPKCNIYFCFMCWNELIDLLTMVVKCPMCGRELVKD